MEKLQKLNIQYKALHGFYWMLYCLPTGYITVVLLAHGYSSAVIGAIVAGSNIIAAAGQLIVGNIADRYPRATWRNLILFIGILQMAILIVLVLFKKIPVMNLIFFPAFMILMFFQMPLVNSSIFYYTAQGLCVDFGSARGTGSVTYAIISFIAGQLVAIIGEDAVIYLSFPVLAGLLITTFFMPCTAEKKMELQKLQRSEDCSKDSCLSADISRNHSGNIIRFIKRYPDYMTVLIGSILLMAFHNIGHTYMIQIMESAGGNSASMGVAFSIEALAELPVMFLFYKLIKRFSSDSLMRFCSIAFIAKAAAYLIAVNVTSLYFAQLLQMFSYAVFASASVYYANDKMDPADKVSGQGYMTASISIGAVVGNLLGGLVLEFFDTDMLLLVSLALTITGAAVVTLGVQKGRAKRL